jgi:hypothetical protein
VLSNEKPASETPLSELNEDTLNFIFDLTRDAPSILSRALDETRTRLFQVLGVSSALIALAGLGVGQEEPPRAAAILLGLAVLTYIVSTVIVLVGSWTATVRTTYYADEIWQNEWETPVIDIKHSIVVDVACAYKYNRELLKRRGNFLNAAISVTAIETVLIGASIITRWV